jgi:diaminopimelate decarboxylase
MDDADHRTFHNHDGKLFLGEVDLVELSRVYGTPLFVTSEEMLRENYRRLWKAFKAYYDNFEINYAVKANNNLAIISVLRQEGAGADVSSKEELMLARLAGVPEKKVLFSPNYAGLDELKYALFNGVAINFDDIDQFTKLSPYGLPHTVSFRVNPGFGAGEFPGIITAGPSAKFGLPEEYVSQAYSVARDAGAKTFGIHMMTGSNVLQPDYFAKATAKLLSIAGRVSQETGLKFEFIDIGGGLGVPYRPSDKPLEIQEVGRTVAEVFKSKCQEYSLGWPRLVVEPGRFLVADTTVLLGRVHHVKRYARVFVGSDVGMNVLIRPALYGAYHEVVVANRLNEPQTMKASLVGQVCENTDLLGENRSLPETEVGDTVAVFNAGAYGFSMSSQYNSRPRPAEVMVSSSGEVHLIRSREEFSDLVNKMWVPAHLLR